MDPVSITLAAISFATAVKDMVELGQKIHASFSKVSKNLRNAQRVAKEIKEMVEEIKVFYENHKDLLDNMKDFGVALEGLLHKFRSFEASVLPLLPQADRRGAALFLRGWWNNNKIEGRLLELEGDIVKVMRRHMASSAPYHGLPYSDTGRPGWASQMNGVMRNEVKLEKVHQDSSRGFADVQKGITQGLEILGVVRRHVSIIAATPPHRSYNSSGTTSDDFDRKVIMFAQSTPSASAPMLRTPNMITEELMTAAYIKLQINSLTMTVEKMSTLPTSALDSVALNSIAPFQLSSVFKESSMTITHLRHHVVRELIGIRDLLETEHIHTISIHERAIELNNLSDGLKILGMGSESILVGKWAITLARTLADASGGGHPDLAATLALNLLNQSIRYFINGNRIQSLQAIEEAYTIAKSLWNQHKGEANFQILYGDILLQFTGLVDKQRSIEMCIEAVQVLEDILNVQAYTQPKLSGKIQNVVHHSSSFVEDLFSWAPPETAIKSYAYALHRLGNFLSFDGDSETALDLQLLAIAVRRKMVSTHGHEHKVALAWALSSLVRGKTASLIPAEELLNAADECIQLFRELAEKNPVSYARALVDMLLTKADTLESLDRDTEAIATWEEGASLAGQIIQDSKLCAGALNNLSNLFRRLKRHDDAVRTGTLAITTHHDEAETQAWRYFYLSLDLQQLRRYKESADAARTSVMLCRHLAMRDSVKWTNYLARGVANLAHCLAVLGDHSEALTSWKESMSMLDNSLNTIPDATENLYLATLYSLGQISYVLENEEECLEINSTAAQYLRQLSKIYPQSDHVIRHLFEVDFRHAYNMLRFGYLQDAQRYIDHWFDVWSTRPETISESVIVATHAGMMILKADVLDARGCTKEALWTTQKVPEIVGQSVTTYQFSFSQMIDSMVHEARLQVSLGDSEQALQVAERALQLSRDNKPEPFVNDLVWSLHVVAFTALSRRNYKRAIEAAQEGCNLSVSPNWQGNFEDIFLRPSLFAIWSSAEANLGRCSTALEYALRAVKESLDIRDRKADIPATVAEHSYIETRGNLADILLATGDLAQARQICKERSTYFSKRAEKRMGNYRELAPILRMLGILCCTEGHHEEGDAAAQELSRIMKTLGSAFPSLQEQVKIWLRNQAKVPILKVLEDMQRKLDCDHQAEVLSLFAV